MNKVTKKLIVNNSTTDEMLEKLKQNNDIDPKFKKEKKNQSDKSEQFIE